MVSNNLKFDIVGDASKFTAAVELAELQIQNLRRLARSALRKGDAAGAAEYTQQIGKLRIELGGLNRTLEQTGAVAASTSRSMAISARSFRSVEQAVLGLGRSLGGAKAGLAAFAAALAVREIAGGIQKTVDSINELNKTASNLALPPATVKAYQDQLAKQGLSAEQTNAALGKLSQGFFDAQLKAGVFNNVLTSGVNVLKGSESSINGISQGVVTMRGSLSDGADAASKFVNVWRGGQPAKPVNDLTDAVERFLKINPAAFKPGDVEAYNLAVAKALQNTKGLTDQLRSQIGQQVFGPDWQKVVQGLVQGAAEFDKAKAAAANIITPEAQAAVTDYNRAWGELSTTITDTATTATTESLPAITAGIDAATASVNGLAAAWRSFGSALGSAAIAGAPVGPGGFAEGGYVSGPGTATSDSILARVSAGEYVMRARAVDHWGPRFMASLNALRSPFGFAGGGLVMPQRSLPRFAEGGLVAAGAGGAPVHLHLGGHSFALSGSTGVVDALVVEARRQQVRSAGIKPSWYGGRPGGH